MQEPLLSEERRQGERRSYPRPPRSSLRKSTEGGDDRIPVTPEELTDLLREVREMGGTRASFRQSVTRLKNTKRQRILPSVSPRRDHRSLHG